MTAVAAPTHSLSSSIAPPTGAPDTRRKFQLTEFGDNHNKWWQVETWDLGGGKVRMRATWGRVGSAPQSKDKICREAEVDRTIAEKQAKGYQELDLHTPPVVTATTTLAAPVVAAPPRKVVELLDIIFKLVFRLS